MRFGMNFPRYVVIPFTEVGNGIFVIASIFTGSTFTLSDDMGPRNTMDFTPI